MLDGLSQNRRASLKFVHRDEFSGPVRFTDVARPGEFVPVDELERCAAILRQSIQHFCVSGNCI